MTDEQLQLEIFGFIDIVPPGSVKAEIMRLARVASPEQLIKLKQTADKIHKGIEKHVVSVSIERQRN